MPTIDLFALEEEVKRCLDEGLDDKALEVLRVQAWSPQLPQLKLRSMEATAKFRLGMNAAAEESFKSLSDESFKMAMVAKRNHASLLFKAERYEESLEAITEYRQFFPYEPKGLSLQTSNLVKLERFDIALRELDGYLAAVPGDPEALLAAVYASASLGDWVKVVCLIGNIERRYGLDEEAAGLMSLSFMEMDLLAAAEMLLLPALSGPEGGTTTTRSIAGSWCYFSRKYAQAEHFYKSALGRGDYDKAVVCDHAFTLLALGNYKEGWAGYARRKTTFDLMRIPGIPEWEGESLEDKRVLVNWEQGLGDSIQFMRYLPALQQQVADVVFNAQPAIVSLLPTLHGGMAEESLLQKLDQVDVQIHLADLPLICGTDSPAKIPVNIPYLPIADENNERWRARLKHLSGKKIGIVWSGNRKHENDAHRSARLEDFYPLAALPGVSWVSLQIDESRQEILFRPGDWQLLDLGAEIQNFADTAAIVNTLDLVISVDTSVAHLAGALGKPVWILLPGYRVDWRWELDAEKSPWYPSARLFRQKPSEGWQALVSNAVRSALWDWLRSDDALPSPHVAETVSGFLAQASVPAGWTEHLEREDLAWAIPLALMSAPSITDADSLFQRFGHLAEWQNMISVLRLLAGVPEAEFDLQRLDKSGALGTTERVRWAEWLRNQQRPSESAAVLRAGLRNTPDDPRLTFGLANSSQLIEGGSKEALDWFERTIKLYPRAGLAVLEYACELMNQNRGDEALEHFGKAIRLLPGDNRPLFHLALHLRRRGLANVSKRILRALMEKQPTPAVQCGLAESMALCGEDAAAEELLDVLDPESLGSEDRAAYAIALRALGQEEEYQRILESVDANDETGKTAHYLRGWRWLQTGAFEQGWNLFCAALPAMRTGVPEWKGEALEGKNVVVYQDHGFGDLVQFLPLISDLARLNCRITLAVHKAAYEFVAFQALPARVIDIADLKWMAEAFDFQISQMRLPKFLRTDLLRHEHVFPFLRAPGDRLGHWQKRLASDTSFKIGIIWAGNPRYVNDWFRSTELTDWESLGGVEGTSFYSFQKDVASNQAAVDEALGLHNLAADCSDWLDTASMLQRMDLVISVDSGGAHMAAGLGRETWILVPTNVTDYRWQLEREDCPWYPTVRLFRQARGESWRTVLDRVAIALRDRVMHSQNAKRTLV